MGFIYRHDTKGLADRYGLSVFVETGTYLGAGVLHAVLSAKFDTIHSIELLRTYYEGAKKQFESIDGVHIHPGRSDEVLPQIVPNIKDNIMFWLDAHLPSNHVRSYYDQSVELPLESELSAIRRSRDIKRDVFIIDDLRIYEDGPFENGDWPRRGQFSRTNSDFIDRTFERTHNIERDYRDEGYIIATPKTLNPEL